MHAAFFLFRRPTSTAVNPSCFSNHLQPQNLLQPAPSPVGVGWGEGILQVAATFPNTLTAPIQALWLVALSLTLSHGREDGVAVGIKGFARKTASRRPYVGRVRYARTRSPFSLQPQPTARVPCGTHPTDGFKGRLKKRSRRLFHPPCDRGYLKNSFC